MRDHFWRIMVYSPYFDQKTAWYPTGLVYSDSYAIYKNSPLLTQHPEFVLKDSSGRSLFIPYACSGGTCPQYAGDISNPAFRRHWIDGAKALMTKGVYSGLWIDDVNMAFRVGDGNGTEVAPIDPNTGTTMTWDNWRRYMAEFMEQVRAELPNITILHNSIWYAGPGGVRDQDQYIQRQIAAADLINCEHGVNDGGLTGGTGEWSLQALLAFIDRLHAKGKGAIVDDFGTTPTAMEYALANYLLISTGKDGLGNQSMTQDNWWRGYDVNLGAALGARYSWNGLMRRDFQGGMVVMNEPGSPTRTVSIPGSLTKIDGTPVTSITLAGKQGAVLLGNGDTTAPSISGLAVGSVTSSGAAISWNTNEAADGQVEYGLSTAYGQSTPLVSALTTAHSMILSGLSPSSTYALRVRSRDASGNLAVATGSFATPAGGTGASLGIVKVAPINGSTNVAVNALLTAQFTSAANSATLTPANFTLIRQGTTTAVSAKITYDPASLVASLAPAAALAPGVSYTATLKSGILSSSGTSLGKDYAWTFTTQATAGTVSKARYLSDLAWTYNANGWGPVERDKSLGDLAAGDGRPLTLNGVRYGKGLGVHSYSDVRFNISNACSAFQADVGIDDEMVGPSGSIVFQVFADGVKVFDSGLMRPDTATKQVYVSLSGKNELRLVVTDAGDGPGSDHGDWANARINCSGTPAAAASATTAYLSDLTWTSGVNGWGPVEKDLSNNDLAAGDGRLQRLNGISYAKGLGVHALSDVRFNLAGSCSAFAAEVGVDDEAVGPEGSVVFQVWGDGVKLYDSGAMRFDAATKLVNVNVAGKKELRLYVTDAGDGLGWDHADWANARVVCAP
jgi:hypothetical protein